MKEISKAEFGATNNDQCDVFFQATALREELRSVEQRLSKAKEQALDYKAANSMLQGEKKKADKAKAEATELREKMDLMKNIEFVVNASAPEVNNKLHQVRSGKMCSKIFF